MHEGDIVIISQAVYMNFIFRSCHILFSVIFFCIYIYGSESHTKIDTSPHISFISSLKIMLILPSRTNSLGGVLPYLFKSICGNLSTITESFTIKRFRCSMYASISFSSDILCMIGEVILLLQGADSL